MGHFLKHNFTAEKNAPLTTWQNFTFRIVDFLKNPNLKDPTNTTMSIQNGNLIVFEIQ